MINNLKQVLYFPIASYFRFFAAIRLKRWNPRVIVVTGSNGKTTLLHLLEAQIGKKAKYSHHANSAYGIPFDILNLHRKTLQKSEWFSLIIRTTLQLFQPLPKEKIYVVEADADRPHEGKFLAELLRPEVVLWVSTARTHSMNFDHLVHHAPRRWLARLLRGGTSFTSVEEAIAYEYGHFITYCNGLVMIDGDSTLEKSQVSRTKAPVIQITKRTHLTRSEVTKAGTDFTLNKETYRFNALLPEELYLSLEMVKETVRYLGLSFDKTFSSFTLPPGRGTILRGINNTTLIDSTYNGNLDSIRVMLEMFELYPSKKKWVILGDMKELGEEEKEEHEKLARIINEVQPDQVILIGQLSKQYTKPKIEKNVRVESFSTAPEAVSFLREHIRGGEVLLLKGSQSVYLEGIIERLLQDETDKQYLPRQEAFWEKQRRNAGFA